MVAILVSTLSWAAIAMAALEVDFASVDSIKAGAALVAADLMSFYDGDQPGKTVGILPGPPPAGPYFWWNAGAMWGTMVDYWFATGDTTYNDIVERSLVFQSQSGKHDEFNFYEPNNVTLSLGNDDQGFWGLSALLAAETNFQNPPSSDPQWLALAQAVFNRQSLPVRHDDVCGGGMRWQIPITNRGYDYKNSIANGCYFNIGARLARYTGNATYSILAEDTWDWIKDRVKFIDDEYNVWDGAQVDDDCTDIHYEQYSYNAGIFIQGVAYMYDFTGDEKWKTRLDGLVDRTIAAFFQLEGAEGIMVERRCEVIGPQRGSACSTDMLSYKGFVHRWLANTIVIAPHLRDKVYPFLMSSAQAAVKLCTGGTNGRMCGFSWANGVFDSIGVGQQMNVLGALTSLLTIPAPVTEADGGTSKGEYPASSESQLPPLSNGDIAGASLLTAIICVGIVAVVVWMSTNLLEGGK